MSAGVPVEYKVTVYNNHAFDHVRLELDRCGNRQITLIALNSGSVVWEEWAKYKAALQEFILKVDQLHVHYK